MIHTMQECGARMRVVPIVHRLYVYAYTCIRCAHYKRRVFCIAGRGLDENIVCFSETKALYCI